MTDFYTVLRNAIDQADPAGSPGRAAVYARVRALVSRKLHSSIPPLPSREINARLKSFDAAAARVETEFAPEPAMAEAGPTQAERRPIARPQPESDPFAEAAAAWSASPLVDTGLHDPIWDSPAIELAFDAATDQWIDPSEESAALADDGWGSQQPAPLYAWVTADPPDRAPEAAPAADPRTGPDAPSPRPGDETGDDGSFGDAHGWFRWFRRRARGEDDAEAEAQSSTAEAARAFGRARRNDDGMVLPEIAEEAEVEDSAEARPGLFARLRGAAEANRTVPWQRGETPPEAAPPGMAEHSRRDPEPAPAERRKREPEPARDPARLDVSPTMAPLAEQVEPRLAKGRELAVVRAPAVAPPLPDGDDEVPAWRLGVGRIFAVGVGLAAIVVIGWCVVVFGPLLFPSGPGQVAAVADDPTLPVSSDAAPRAVRAAPAEGEVSRTIVLFDGRDPDVFESGTNNPVRYQSAVDGGVARITSSASAAGVRAVLDPALAERLGGQRIRLVMVARSAPENGAARMRLAWLRDGRMSDWQEAALPGDFSELSLVWDIPKDRREADSDYLLIQPGIPGDGTATDIKSIRIEILS